MERLDELVRARAEAIAAAFCDEAARAPAASRLGREELAAAIRPQLDALGRRARDGEPALPREVVERALALRLRQGYRPCEVAAEYALLERCVIEAWQAALPDGARPPAPELSRLHRAVAEAAAVATARAHGYLLEEQPVERRHLDRLARLGRDGALAPARLGELAAELRAALAARGVSLLWWSEGALRPAGDAGDGDGALFAAAAPVRAAGERGDTAELSPLALGASGAALVQRGVRSLLVRRLAHREEPLGLVVAAFADPPPADAWRRLRLESLCERVALLIDNAHLVERTRAHLAELEEERAQQERLVGMMAHDLRGPLTVALFGAQLLAQRPTGDERAFLTDKVIRSLQRADRMLRDLLDYSRVRAGQPLPLLLGPCRLGDLARGVCDELGLAHGRDRFRLLTPEDVDGVWCADALQRAVWNLLQNAVKYGAQDEPITITVERTGEGAALSVHNLGAPMDDAEMKRIFEPYRQVRRERGGWGLGLALVRACAEAHGGRVEVASTEAAGTTFTVHLPLDARRAVAEAFSTVH